MIPVLLVVPCVLADREGDGCTSDLSQRLPACRQEPASFVEDVIGRQQHLVLPEHKLALSENRGRVCGALSGGVIASSPDVAGDYRQREIAGFGCEAVELLPGAC